MLSMGYTALHVGKCVFAKHRKIRDGEKVEGFSCHKSKICALALVHVDDIISIGEIIGRKLFREGNDSLTHGDSERLTATNPVVFCGLSISMDSRRVLTLSEKEFYDRIAPLELKEVVEKGGIIIPMKELRRKLEAIIG